MAHVSLKGLLPAEGQAGKAYGVKGAADGPFSKWGFPKIRGSTLGSF